jgi:hypothetical protein
LPERLELPFIDGPIDYPQYGEEVKPEIPDIQFIGYTPTEISSERMPPAQLINSQGLPPAGDFHVWMPTHILLAGEEVIRVATALDVSERVPGVVEVTIQAEDSRGREPRMVTVALNPAEFLYAMAQVYRQLATKGRPGNVALVSMKVAANQRTECALVKPGGARDSFIWRSPLSPAELNAAWTTYPQPGEDEVLWMSLPPLGDKVKMRMGRLIGEWQRKKT